MIRDRIRDDYGRAYDSWPRTFKITDGTIYDRSGVGISQPYMLVIPTITHTITYHATAHATTSDHRITKPMV
jgi:hypothetical protein